MDIYIAQLSRMPHSAVQWKQH